MQLDLTTILTNPVQMAFVVGAIVAFIKKRMSISGDVTILLSVIVSMLLYVAIPLIPQNVLGLIGTAIATGITASGGIDLTRGVSEKVVQKYAEFRRQ